MAQIDKIKKRAKLLGKTIVLPEATDLRVLEAASIITKENIANIILIGNEKDLIEKGKEFNLDKVRFIDASSYDDVDSLITLLYELRKEKGMTLDKARELIMNNNLYFGAMLVKKGVADGMVAGCTTATADVLRPALQIIKTAPNTKLVSAFFLMEVPDCKYGDDGTFIFADSGLNPNPTAEEIAEIAKVSAKTFETLCEGDAKVAMLSFSTKGSAKHADVTKMEEATSICITENPTLNVDGTLQLDAAIVPEVASSKAPDSKVAGKANVLIFPDLDAGNIGYKLVQRLAKAEAYGPITQGLAMPVNDLSRGCSALDIVGVVAITAVQTIK